MDAIIFALAIAGGLVVVRAVASFFELRARMRDQMRSAPRGEIIRDPNDDPLEILERVARACAEQARRDAENLRGTTAENIHRETQTRYLRFAKMVKTVRLPPQDNVRQLRR
jgi:hypothetical protein